MNEPPHPGFGDSDRPGTADGDRREARFVVLRAAVQGALDDIKAGRVADLDQALDRVEAMLDELEAAKRANPGP